MRKPVRYFHRRGRLPTTVGYKGVYLCTTILITLSLAWVCVRGRIKKSNTPPGLHTYTIIIIIIVIYYINYNGYNNA